MKVIDYTEPAVCEHNEDVSSVRASRSRLRLPIVVALSFRLRDMGNGVDRIERCTRIRFDEAVAGADLPDREPLPQPTPPRILDAVVQTLGAIGIQAPGFPELLVEGYCTAPSEREVEVVAWMALLV